ncbi:MAG: hypothetical protein GX413_04320 [Acetobacter sp.]|nr:hypothetical protein [Acetobacter sp.]
MKKQIRKNFLNQETPPVVIPDKVGAGKILAIVLICLIAIGVLVYVAVSFFNMIQEARHEGNQPQASVAPALYTGGNGPMTAKTSASL